MLIFAKKINLNYKTRPYLNSFMNRQNCGIWRRENIQTIQEKPISIFIKINFLTNARRMTGLYFLEDEAGNINNF